MTQTWNYLARRKLLNANGVPPENLIAAGRDMVEEGFLSDALDFFAKAGDEEVLAEIEPLIMEDGDFFLFMRLMSTRGQKPTEEQLRHLSENAARVGKESFVERIEAWLSSRNPAPE